jgi:hypothetical protein
MGTFKDEAECDKKLHVVTPDYAVTGWCKAFRIGDGEHLKTRLNVIKK